MDVAMEGKDGHRDVKGKEVAEAQMNHFKNYYEHLSKKLIFTKPFSAISAVSLR